jgi:hypothetical protein
MEKRLGQAKAVGEGYAPFASDSFDLYCARRLDPL